MRLFVALFLSIISSLVALDEPLDKVAKPGYCYSILTEVGHYTPVVESYFANVYEQESCTLFDRVPSFSDKMAYVGCYKKRVTAESKLQTMSFNFKNPIVTYHRVYDGIPYVIFPQKSSLKFKNALNHLENIYRQNTIKKVLEKFPSRFYGSGLELYDLQKADFLPTINLYPFYMFNKEIAQKILVLYDGSYTIEDVYTKLGNEKYIHKVNANTYEINIPIAVMPNASLAIQNKTVRLQARPNSVFIMYYGKLYAKNTIFLTWDKQKNKYCKRENVPRSKILYTNYEKPRPYLLGLSGSRGYFVNNIFRGLGFHSTSATFGLAVLSPKMNDFFPISQAFYYFISNDNAPTGSYIGNDISDSTMAFYTNGGKNIAYLGNYTHDNVIYNFDPHDYSTGLVIARNIATKAKIAHGIILSRGCDHNYISENIALSNNANGIMVDRSSNHNLIYNNLSYGNGFMGITSIESRDILVKQNVAVGNLVDGLMVRNTLRLEASDNLIEYNGKNGVELLSKNIDRIPGRDLQRDPYVKAASAVVTNNKIQNNYNSNIMVKNGAAIRIDKNRIPNNIGLSGDLNFFYSDITQRKGSFTLYGLGFPFIAKSTDKMELSGNAYRVAKGIYKEIADESNDYFGTHLGGLFLNKEERKLTNTELIRAGSNFSKGALTFLGYIYLADARKAGFTDKKKIVEGLSYIIEDAILTDNVTKYHQIEKTRFFIPNGKEYIEEGFKLALQRMEEGRLFDAENYKKCPLCEKKLFDKYKILAAMKIFRYKYSQTKSENFIHYCQNITQNYTIFTTQAKIYFDRLITEKNAIKRNVNYYNTKVYKLARKDKLCNRYLVKQEKDKRKLGAMMKNQEMKRVALIKPKMEELLKKVNQYRVRKISMQDLMRMVQEAKSSSLQEEYGIGYAFE